MPADRHRSLVKPLEPSSRAAARLGPKRLDAGRFEIVDDAGAERGFRSDHDEIDAVGAAIPDQRCVVGDIEGDAFGFARDTGIAGCADKPVCQRTSRHFPG